GGVIHNVSSIISHEDFSLKTVKNDIALMHLSDPITVNSHAGVVDLAEEDFDLEEGSVVQISGWGATRNVNETNQNLRFVEVVVQDQQKCAKAYKKHKLSITENQYCAGTAAGDKDSCTGDSGGPSTYEGVQVGIVSYGKGCARAKYPGVYTKISKYRQWSRIHTGI
ncbi:serine protease, partial [Phocaeicola vulgatus]